jgi:dienelactone hydrolase
MIDTSKQAVMGWSMGGGGALIAAANDPTLKAAIPQAPYETGSNDFDEITTPTLILACESDGTAPVSQHASPFYNRIPSSTNKAFLEINNGQHSCANSGNSNEDLLGKYGVAWMKRFMDDDTRYSTFLCGAPHQSDLNGSTISEYRETCPY